MRERTEAAKRALPFPFQRSQNSAPLKPRKLMTYHHVLCYTFLLAGFSFVLYLYVSSWFSFQDTLMGSTNAAVSDECRASSFRREKKQAWTPIICGPRSCSCGEHWIRCFPLRSTLRTKRGPRTLCSIREGSGEMFNASDPGSCTIMEHSQSRTPFRWATLYARSRYMYRIQSSGPLPPAGPFDFRLRFCHSFPRCYRSSNHQEK